jgi:hypothetical protein
MAQCGPKAARYKRYYNKLERVEYTHKNERQNETGIHSFFVPIHKMHAPRVVLHPNQAMVALKPRKKPITCAALQALELPSVKRLSKTASIPKRKYMSH